ncbi:MAG: hypothetical protein JSS75_08670 [Bacteroidetes bacterium]|nr:hypothetical protein [Bacteroidota bacterium]
MNTRSLLFAFALVLIGMSSVFAQSADEVVDKYLAAIGGKDAWHNLHSIRMVGEVNANGTKIPMTLTVVHKKAMRQDMTVMGMSGINIVTANGGWVYMPFAGQKEPEAQTPDAVKMQQDQLDIQGQLLDYKQKGETCEYIGKEDVDGTECYKLKLTKTNGTVSSLFIDPSNNYLIRTTTKAKVDGQDQEQTINFSNFEKVGNGLIFPMAINMGMGDVKFTKIEINPTIDDKIFDKPVVDDKH